LGAYGQAILKQPTVFRALTCAVELGRKYNTSLSLRLEREGQSILYFRRFELSSEVGLHHAEYFAQALTLAALSSWSGVNWRPSEMGYQSCAPMGFNLESNLQVRAVFGQRESSIRIPGWLLAKRLRPGRLGDSEHCPLDQTPLHWVEALRTIIKALLYEESVGIRTTAEAAGMSVRSLQRRLLAEGYTYSGLVDEVRFSLAVSLMKDPDRKMIDIALDLGYESPGSFTRAFRRWSGFSPQEFCRLSLGADLETSEFITRRRPA
jgi:AraC-like DNA-binding protein